MTDSRDEHEPYGFTESPVIAKMQADIARLTAERDEARRDAERWQDDALRLLNERKAAQEERDELRSIANKALRERDEARREVCYASTQPPRECAADRGWGCFKEADK
jgi:hypothetical protein